MAAGQRQVMVIAGFAVLAAVFGHCATGGGGGNPSVVSGPCDRLGGSGEPIKTVDDFLHLIQAGLVRNDPGAAPGYTLFEEAFDGTVSLIDNAGHMVHQWDLPATMRWHAAELLADGHLMISWRKQKRTIGLLDADGEVVWQYTAWVHHDHLVMPNGNLLLLLREVKSREEVIAAGANPAFVEPDGLKVDYLVEVRPTPPSGGQVVWRWSPWDHLVQDFDPDKPNYGRPADHPGRVDLNFLLEKLTVAAKADRVNRGTWLHANAIDHHAEADHILFLARSFSELWVIDHSTTAEESAGRSGGRHGRGGDLLWRWGNPRAHGAGTVADQRLFWPHAAHWIPAGLPGAGDILLFNNGDEFGGLRRDHSEVSQLAYPLDDPKFGAWPGGEPHPPSAPNWRYVADPPGDFLSFRLSNAQRLANGNTLITSGAQGRLFEVTPQGREVWRYVSPIVNGERLLRLLRDGPVPCGTVMGKEPFNAVYRAFRYPPDYPGLKALDLTPKGTLARQEGARAAG